MTESGEEETLNPLKRICKIPMETGRRRTIPEETLLEIIARLPLRSIARLKSVCKTWKSVIESPYFRRLFVSLHRNSSSSWSLMFRTYYRHYITEAIGFHGCETWDRPKSLGTWTFKRLLSSIPLQRTITYYHPININGMLYLWGRRLDPTEPGVLVAHDFYGPEADNQCRVIPLPLPYNKHFRRCLTTSGGDVIYIEILDQRLKVWRLNNNNSESECWQLSREEIDMASVGFDVYCIPMAMNPFDTDIIYLWSLQHCCFVSGNLRTNEFIVHQESENWSSSKGCYRINTYDTKGYMEGNRNVTKVLMLSQFVLPRWMDSVPRPPN